MRSRVERLAVVALAAAALTAGCRDAHDSRPTIEVFGPIVGEAGERLAASMRDASATASVELRYVGVTSFNEQLEDRLQQGDRPSIVLLPQPGLLDDLASRGLAEPLPDEVAAAATVNYPAELVDLVRRDGKPAAVWVTIDIKSLVWFRPAALADRQLGVPTTLDELESLSERIRVEDSGVAPWCVTMADGASTGWVGTDWVEDVVLRRLGDRAYRRWTEGDLAFDDPSVVAVFDELDRLLRTPGATAGGPRTILTVPWGQSAHMLVADPPRCVFVHQADFLRRDLPSGTSIGADGDVDVFVMPSTDGTPPPLVVGGTLAVPLRDDPGVDAALAVLAGDDLATRLDRTGLFLSPHLDVTAAADSLPARLLDVVAASDDVVFDGADLMPPTVGTGSFWRGMQSFFAGEDVASVVLEIQAGWDEADARTSAVAQSGPSDDGDG